MPRTRTFACKYLSFEWLRGRILLPRCMQILARPLMISSISKLVYNCEVSRSYGMTAKEHFNISSGLGCCFLISYWRYNNIIVQARKSEKSLSKRLVPFSEPEKSLQVLNTAQTKEFGQKNSTVHAHEVRKKTTIDWLLWNNFIGTVERIILLYHVCKPSWICVDVDPKEVSFFQDLVIYCTKTTDWKGYTK